MSIAVRATGSDDIPALVALDTYVLINPARATQITLWVESGQCFVAEREGELLGFAVLNRAFFHSFFIELLMVSETHRRSGLGTALIQHLIGILPPGEKLWTSTNKSNADMQTLLHRLGFIPSGQIDNLDEGDPELVFVHLPA